MFDHGVYAHMALERSSFLSDLVEKFPGGEVYNAPDKGEVAGIFRQVLQGVAFIHEPLGH